MVTKKRAKIMPWIAALAVAALVGILAIPSLAATSTNPDKIFSLEVAPHSTPPSTWTSTNYLNYKSGPVTSNQKAVTFTVSAFNRTPGNSNFSSFDVTVPNDFVLKGATKAPGSNVNSTYALSFPNASGNSLGAVVRVTGLNAVKTNQFAGVNIAVDVNPTSSCGSLDSQKWSAIAYAGNISSTTFRQLSDNPSDPYTLSQGVTPSSVSHYLVTQIDPSCGIAFVSQPADTAQGQVIKGTDGNDLAVGVYRNGVLDPSAGGTISLAIDSPSTWANKAIISGNGASTIVSGEATFPALKISDLDGSHPAADTYTLKATYSVGGATATSDPFVIADAQVCPGTNDPSYTEGSTTVTLNGENCAFLTVTSSNSDTQQLIDVAVTKTNPTDKITGFVDWKWTNPLRNADGSIVWTQVHWDGGPAGYSPLQLCNAGVNKDTNFSGLFPPGQGMCLLHQEVTLGTGTDTNVYETENLAFDVDMSGTKLH